LLHDFGRETQSIQRPNEWDRDEWDVRLTSVFRIVNELARELDKIREGRLDPEDLPNLSRPGELTAVQLELVDACDRAAEALEDLEDLLNTLTDWGSDGEERRHAARVLRSACKTLDEAVDTVLKQLVSRVAVLGDEHRQGQL